MQTSRGGDDDEPVEGKHTHQSYDQQEIIEVTVVHVCEPQLPEPEKSNDDCDATDEEKRQLGAVEDHPGHQAVIELCGEHEKEADANERHHADEETKEQTLIGLVAFHALVKAVLMRIAMAAFRRLSNRLEYLIKNGCGDQAILDGARVEVRRRFHKEGLLGVAVHSHVLCKDNIGNVVQYKLSEVL